MKSLRARLRYGLGLAIVILMLAATYVGPIKGVALVKVASAATCGPPSSNPSADIQPNYSNEQGAIAEINLARAQEGVPALNLPANYYSMAPSDRAYFLINAERVDRGLPGFSGNDANLGQVASNHSKVLNDFNLFAHVTAVDGSPSTRITQAPGVSGHSSGWGEIIAQDPGGLAAGSVFLWMYDDSVEGWGHRDIILNSCYNVVGVGSDQNITYTGDFLISSSSSPYQTPNPVDATAPSLAINSPIANAQGLSSSFTVNTTATDNNQIRYVDFFLDDNFSASTVPAGTQSGSTYTYNFSNISNGTHKITVVAVDTTNNFTRVDETVTVGGTSGGGGGGGNTGAYNYALPFLGNNAPGIGGNYTSYLAFQNTSNTTANVTVTYYDPSGNDLHATNPCATVAAHAECVAANPFNSGSKGTGIINSDQPLAVIVAEGTPYGGSAYAVSSTTSNQLVAPIIMHNAYGDFSTQLTVYNVGTSSTTATVTFYDQNGAVQSGAAQNLTIPAKTAITLDQAASNSGLANGFNGWAQITGANGSQLIAQTLEQSASQNFVAVAAAQPFSQTSTTLYAPAIFNKGFGAFNTGTNIVNPGSQPVSVTISYYDDNGNLTPTTPFMLGGNSLVSIYQGGSGGTSGLPNSGLASGFAGAAVISSSGSGVLMVVNESGGQSASGASLSGIYSANSKGSNGVSLPVMANGGYSYTTGATVFNTGSQAVNGTIQYYDVNGNPVGSAQSFTVPAFGSYLAYQGNAGLTQGYYGSAVVSQTSGGGTNGLIVTTNALSNLFYTYTEPNS